jgi:hypothetical protein
MSYLDNVLFRQCLMFYEPASWEKNECGRRNPMWTMGQIALRSADHQGIEDLLKIPQRNPTLVRYDEGPI